MSDNSQDITEVRKNLSKLVLWATEQQIGLYANKYKVIHTGTKQIPNTE